MVNPPVAGREESLVAMTPGRRSRSRSTGKPARGQATTRAESSDSDYYTEDSETDADPEAAQEDGGDTWTAEDERIYRDNLDIVDKLHWEAYIQKDELELAHHLPHHQGEDIIDLKRMIILALDSAQAAKGAVVQVLAEMTAM